MSSEKKGYIATILMSLIMGMQYIFIKDLIKLSHNNVFLVLSIRFFIAFIFLLFIFYLKKIKIHLSFKNKDLFRLSFYNPIVNFSFQTIGVMLCPVTTVSVLIALIPIANVIISYFLLKEKPTLKQSFFICICIIGTIIASISSSNNNKSEFALIGTILIILSIFSRSYYQGKLKKLKIKDINQVSIYQIFYGFIAFTIMFFAFYFVNPTIDVLNIIIMKDFIFGILYLSILATVLVFYLNNYAVNNISVISVGLMNNITVLISTIAGIIFLGEKFTLIQILGLGMILIGSILYYKNKKDA